MKQYDLVNRCLETLKYSDIDMMERLRLENLLIQMKMLLLVDVYKQDAMPEIFKVHNFEDLLSHVQEVCIPGVGHEAVRGLVKHVKMLHASMASYLSQG